MLYFEKEGEWNRINERCEIVLVVSLLQNDAATEVVRSKRGSNAPSMMGKADIYALGVLMQYLMN